jgi:NAD(P)-dependent dehydrogenase (short-subunit alcohol dehydrogenase family)
LWPQQFHLLVVATPRDSAWRHPQLAVPRGLAETLTRTGVTVNCVLPGPTAGMGESWRTRQPSARWTPRPRHTNTASHRSTQEAAHVRHRVGPTPRTSAQLPRPEQQWLRFASAPTFHKEL